MGHTISRKSIKKIITILTAGDPGTAARGREYQGGACRGRRVVGFWHVSGA